MAAPYTDGTFTSAVQDGPYRKWYPFVNSPTKDTNTEGSIYSYVVLAANYVPGASNITAPHANTQYLVSESELTLDNAVGRFTRTFSEVPGPQTYYSTIVLNKPAFPTNDYAGAYVDSTSETAIANVWSAAITSDSVGTRVATGGTFTVTYKTSTTAALNFNDSTATVAAAINALADLVTDATTVSVLDRFSVEGRIRITRATGAGSMTDMSVNRASLTPTCATADVETSATSTYYAAPAAIEVTEAAHGLITNAQVRWYSTAPSGAGTLGTITNTGANTFTLPTSDASSPPNPVYYRKLVRTYTPGTDRLLAKITDTFYLPGVTANITTPEDIPIPSLAINDTQLLALVVGSATGYQNYDAEALTGWPTEDSPIYKQRLIQINVDGL